MGVFGVVKICCMYVGIWVWGVAYGSHGYESSTQVTSHPGLSALENYAAEKFSSLARYLSDGMTRLVRQLKHTELGRQVRYVMNPPDTDERAFRQAISSFGNGFVLYLGCLDSLTLKGKEKAKDLLRSEPTCSSILNSLATIPRFTEQDIAYQRLIKLHDKLTFLYIHSGSQGSSVSAPRDVVEVILQEFESDVDRILSSLAYALLHEPEHENIKHVARTMFPPLLHSLFLEWEVASRLSPKCPSKHHKRLAAAVRDLSRLDECMRLVAVAFLDKGASDSIKKLFVTPKLLRKELAPTALPANMLLPLNPIHEASQNLQLLSKAQVRQQHDQWLPPEPHQLLALKNQNEGPLRRQQQEQHHQQQQEEDATGLLNIKIKKPPMPQHAALGNPLLLFVEQYNQRHKELEHQQQQQPTMPQGQQQKPTMPQEQQQQQREELQTLSEDQLRQLRNPQQHQGAQQQQQQQQQQQVGGDMSLDEWIEYLNDEVASPVLKAKKSKSGAGKENLKP